jgi:hypothetical protein
VTSAQTPTLPDPDALTPAQRQANNARASQTRDRHGSEGQSASRLSQLRRWWNGPIARQAARWDQERAGAIATDLSCVMEGVDNAIGI